MPAKNRPSEKMSTVTSGEVSTRHHRTERLLVTTFRGHVTAELANKAIQDAEREIPANMPEGFLPSIWVVDALAVSGFDGQKIREPGGRLLVFIRDRIAPHMILLRVESKNVLGGVAQAAVIMFARGICLGNGVKLHVLHSMEAVMPYVENLREEGGIR